MIRKDLIIERRMHNSAELAATPDAPGETGLLIRGARTLGAILLRMGLRFYDRLSIFGRENLPLDRSFILVANHASHLDTLCILSALPLGVLHRTYPVAAAEYFCVSPIRAFFAKVFVNALPFDRRSACSNSLSVCAELLETQPGSILIFFPEGTRMSDREPGAFKAGIGLLAAGRDVPVVPCHLSGTRAALPKGTWLPRPRAIRLSIGEPRTFAHLPPTKESRIRISAELRESVIALGTPNPSSASIGTPIGGMRVPTEFVGMEAS